MCSPIRQRNPVSILQAHIITIVFPDHQYLLCGSRHDEDKNVLQQQDIIIETEAPNIRKFEM